MSDVSRDIDKLIDYIGGEENVESVSHCATRLRFILKDMDKADSKKVEELDFVKGSFYQGGQFQVIIGNQAPNYYKRTIQNGKIKTLKNGESNGQSREKSSWIGKISKRINKQKNK